MDAQVLTTIVCGPVILLGIIGTIVPVLPGSLLIVAALLGWALVLANTLGWVVFGIGAALSCTGMLAATVLTGRRLKRRNIPIRSILAGIIVGIIGIFVIPGVGLFLGFALGLLLSELARQRDLPAAAASSLAALKATGIGILTEFGCAALAGSLWVAGVWIYFAAVR